MALDALRSLMSPEPMGGVPGGFTPPPAVKPAVVMIKPRINPDGVRPASAPGNVAPNANPIYDQPTAGAPRLTGGASTSTGRNKLFDSGYWQDTAAGIQNVPQNANAISSFAYGFAGAIQGKAARKAADVAVKVAAEKTQAQADQQKFENEQKIATSAREDRRLALDESKYKDDTLLTKDGNLTAAARLKVEDTVNTYAKSITANNSAGDPPSAKQQADIDAYRKARIAEIKGPAASPSTRWNYEPAATAPAARTAPTLAPPGVTLERGDPGYSGQPAPSAADQAWTAAHITGGGKTDSDPLRGFVDGDPKSEAAFRARVKFNDYFVYTDPETGQESVRQWTK